MVKHRSDTKPDGWLMVSCLIIAMGLVLVTLAVLWFRPVAAQAPAKISTGTDLHPVELQIPVTSPGVVINNDHWVPCEGEVFLRIDSRCAAD